MKIVKLHINSFGCLENLSIDFDDSFLLVEGPNESGKSTLLAFIRAMLFGMEKSRSRALRDNTVNRYLPWSGNPAYGGSLEIEEKGQQYSIYRNFDANRSTCRVFNETEHSEIEAPEVFLRDLLRGLTPQLFDSTLSVAQLTAQPGKPLSDELRNHIVNLRTTGTAGIDVNSALNRLKVKKRSLQSALSRTAQGEADDLNRQAAALQRQLSAARDPSSASSPEQASLSDLEQQKAALEETIRRHGEQHQALAKLAEADKADLQKLGITSEEQIDKTIEDLDALYDEMLNARSRTGSGESASPNERLAGYRPTDQYTTGQYTTGRNPTNHHAVDHHTAGHNLAGHPTPDDIDRYFAQEQNDEEENTESNAERTPLRTVLAVVLFCAAAIMFIFAFSSFRGENANGLRAALLIVGGVILMFITIILVFRSGNRSRHFNIDMDDVYTYGVSRVLKEAERENNVDYRRKRSEKKPGNRRNAEDYPNDQDYRDADDYPDADDDQDADDYRDADDYQDSDDFRGAVTFPKAGADQLRSRQDTVEKLYAKYCPDGTAISTIGMMNEIVFTLDDCRAKIKNAQTSAGRMKNEMDELLAAQQRLSEVNAQLEKAQKDAWRREQLYEELRRLEDRKDALEETLARNARIQEDITAVDLAIKTLQELSSNSFGTLGFYLDQRVSQIAEDLTDGSCADITVNGDLDITIRQAGRLIPLSQASRGTIEQIWLALRMASIEFIWPDGDMPVFLDDTLITYDDERMTATLRWLLSNYPGQIFLFTCHRREAKVLSGLSVPYQWIQF